MRPCLSLHPPLPGGDKRPSGQELLRLLRHHENTPEDWDTYVQIVEILQTFISYTSRGRGIFHEKIEDAKSFLDNVSSSKGNVGKPGKHKSSSHSVSNTKGGPAVDAQLLLSALLRILDAKTSALLLALTGDLIHTICNTVLFQAEATPSIEVLASFELLATSGKQLLQSLHSTNVFTDNDDLETSSKAEESCLQAAAGLVTMLGNKLARNTQLLDSLHEWAAHRIFNSFDEGVRLAASRLLAAVPSGPTLTNVLHCISTVLVDCAPKHASSHGDPTGFLADLKQQWTREMNHESDENIRPLRACNLVHGLVSTATSILNQGDDFSRTIELNMDLLLSVVETMISFPLTSETAFHATKKRLRSQSLAGGVLSVLQLVQQVANSFLRNGCALLQAGLNSIPVQCYARRCLQISHAAIRTTCSATVRQVVDPASALQFSGTRQRWLHKSLTSRASAIGLLQTALLTCGVDPQKKLGGDGNMCSGSVDVERSLQMVAGCLLEALTMKEGDDWGSTQEHASVLVAASSCLTAAMQSGGEYFGIPERTLVERVAQVCLSHLMSDSNVSCPTVRSSFLLLVAAIVETPWVDGSASSLVSLGLDTARMVLRNPQDARTMQAARNLSRLCELNLFPRIPAVSIISSRKENETFISDLVKTHQSTQQNGRTSGRKPDTEAANGSTTPSKRSKMFSGNQVEPVVNNKRPKIGTPTLSAAAAEPNQKSIQPMKDTEEKESDNNLADVSKMRGQVEVDARTSNGEDNRQTERVEANSSESHPPNGPTVEERDNESKGESEEEEDDDDDFPVLVDGDPDEDDS